MTRSRDVTEAELAVLEALWQRETATIRELTDDLYPDGGTSHYATVQKLLDRLSAKGWVSKRRGKTAHVFRARRGREALIDCRLQATADQLCGGSFAPLLSSLVSGRKLSRKERERLKELIDRLDSDAEGGG